jgi:dolichyl-diphosphooligosaccharide--protein glycosyltransferase
MWWYAKPELVFMAAIALVWLLLCLQRNLVTTVSGAAIFLIIADISFANPLGSAYLKEVIREGDLIFPNTFQTITEIQSVSLSQIFIDATGSIEMGLVCLAGLAMFAVRHPVIAIAFGPLVTFGFLNFIIGNRAIFYSAPMLWFGAAFLVTTLARFIAVNLSKAGWTVQRDRIAATAGASLAMVVAWINSPTDYVPQPSFPRPVLEGLASLKDIANPQNAVVATWWDYGYASMFLNELPTLHDGGSQTTPTTHFVAHALLEHDKPQSIGTLKFLSTEGHNGIAAGDSLQELETAFRETNAAPSPDLYLVVTNQMAGWMGSISKIGNWDIEQGKPIQLRGNPDGAEVYYKSINCRFGGYPKYLNCSGAKIDLERGLIDGQPLLVGWTHTQDGEILRRRSFDHDTDHAIQIVQNGGRITAYLLHRQLYESTFNKLYYQGLTEHPAISLHYDDYPHIRIYKVDGTPDS